MAATNLQVAMGELSSRNFGLLIAYILPGFVALWGIGVVVEPVRAWLVGSESAGPTLSGFMFVVLGSIAAGMTVSAVRWAVVDTIHHATGIPKPAWDDGGLPAKLEAYQFLIEIHYRYFQFYANTLVALPFSYALWRWSSVGRSPGTAWADIGVLFIEIVFIAASRDALSKYYRRTTTLLGGPERKAAMTNGGYHETPNPTVKKPKNPASQQAAKRSPSPQAESVTKVESAVVPTSGEATRK